MTIKSTRAGSPDIDTPGTVTVTPQKPSFANNPDRHIESYINRGKQAPQPAFGKSIEKALNAEMAKRRNGSR